MMTGQPADWSPEPAEQGRPGRSVPVRVAAGLAGASLLALSAVFTLGTALAAPVGVLVMRRVARKRDRPLMWGASWLAAVGASSAAVVLAFALAAVRAPEHAFRRLEAAAAARDTMPIPPPPAWLTRVFPQAAQRPDPMTERIVRSRPFTWYFSLIGAGVAVAVLGTIAGSAGWAGTMLLTHTFSRRD